MPQASTIIINNGASTPAPVTFSPEQVSPELSTFVDRSSTTFASYRRLALTSKFASKQSLVNRSGMTIEVPILRMVNGVETVTGYIKMRVENLYPKDSTQSERNDAYAFLVNALNHISVRATLRDYDPQY